MNVPCAFTNTQSGNLAVGAASGMKTVYWQRLHVHATFGGDPLYQTAFERAAAIAESIIMSHPFVDGNKRTGFALMMLILDLDGYWINVPQSEMY